MKKYVCDVCGYIYDPKAGVPEMGIPPGTPFEDLPEGFECPVCGSGKSSFSLVPEAERKKAHAATLREVIVRTPSVKSFRWALAEVPEFKAGQYVTLTLEGNPGLTHCLSLSNSPTERGYLEVTKRITASTFSSLLNEAQPGYEAELSDPQGSFVLDPGRGKIALLSGGIGITPLRSICKYVADRHLETDVCLLYSNRDEDEIAFRNDFAAMQAACANMKIVHSLTRPGSDWTGKKGRIDRAMISEEIPDYAEREFFVCGPPAMVDALSAVLRDELRLSETQVRVEQFSGY